MDPTPPSPAKTEKASRVEAAGEPPRWAGHGHVGAFLLQVGILIAVNLALWGVVFLMALKFAGVIGTPDPGQ
ncbi:MAG: hypothetical protein RLO01_05295 [Thalassobaculaceae bacterium]